MNMKGNDVYKITNNAFKKSAYNMVLNYISPLISPGSAVNL